MKSRVRPTTTASAGPSGTTVTPRAANASRTPSPPSTTAVGPGCQHAGRHVGRAQQVGVVGRDAAVRQLPLQLGRVGERVVGGEQDAHPDAAQAGHRLVDAGDGLPGEPHHTIEVDDPGAPGRWRPHGRARLTGLLDSTGVAELQVDGDELVLHLRAMEKAEGAHGDIRVPLSAVTAVRAVDDPWPELRGIRAPGTGLPNVIAVGTRRGSFGKDFAAVHGKGPAVVVELEGAAYGRLVVTADDAAARAKTIAQAVGKG